MKLITVELFYGIIGVIFAVVAGRVAKDATHPRRWGTAAFWALLAVVFLGGKLLPPLVTGYLIVAMVVLAACKQVVPSAEKSVEKAERAAQAERLKNKVFWPALLIPAVAVVGSLVLDKIHVGEVWLIEPKQVTLIALGFGMVIALGAAMVTTGAGPAVPAREGGRLVQALGWTLILPPMLAALGGIFAKAGVGVVVADLVAKALPTQFPLVAVVAYCGGMALFTMCMGNAFAAFAVITGGIGLPLVVQQHHGNPAIMAAMGMLSGYCGTLMTPMAANFNIVPAMLLDLKDRNAVIKAQVPIGLAMLAANIVLMYFCVYRF
jgi:uncharacterized membrane protein